MNIWLVAERHRQQRSIQGRGERGRLGGRLPWLALAWALALLGTQRAGAANFAPPKAEELAMTSVPGYPGAAAAILFQEEIDDDDLHSITRYERLKVLTDEGKKYANVELKTLSAEEGDNLVAESIEGRTIHPDGTIVPFTGKPYLKVLVKGNGIRYQEKVFTLPDVEVGSILEYRYAIRPDRYFMAPSWLIQGNLFVKEAHFEWLPTNETLQDGKGRMISTISWFPLLPPGAQLVHRETPASSQITGIHQTYELRLKDVPPRTEEDHMPPIESYSYRVLFNFTPFHTEQEFWKDSGKEWAKRTDKFADPGALRDVTDKTIAGAATPEDKLRKIYAAVMTIENTDFTRARDEREVKAAGEKQAQNASEVFANQRGNPEQITELFLGMARAAGFKAYAMLVPDRSERLFTPTWMNFSQFDGTLAIVAVDGKEEFFDPGERYCPFGQVAWEHTYVQGLREVEGGTAFATAPASELKMNHTSRVANLAMAADGQITGKLDFTYTGAAALQWRQLALRADEAELKSKLREQVEQMVPGGLQLEVAEIQNVKEYEQPLLVSFNVTGGGMSRSMGKRVLLPGDLFLSSERAEFPQQKRELPVYFHYPEVVQDATRVKFDRSLGVEAVPSGEKLQMPGAAAYSLQVTQAATNVTTRRDFVSAGIVIPVEHYDELRTFYSQLQQKDQESVVLKQGGSTTAQNGAPAAAQP